MPASRRFVDESTLARVGWREWAWLPELDIGPIKVKMDTGARTSALHAYDIEVDGDVARFKVHTIQGRDDFWIDAEAPFVGHVAVRDSGGKTTVRPTIRTVLRMLDQEREVDITLIDRTDMSFRMLIGRRALSGAYLVDSAAEYLGGVPAEVRGWAGP